MTRTRPVLTREQYFAEAVKRYGKDRNNWKFRCPSCGNTMTVGEYLAAAKAIGDEDGDRMIAFSCIGRLMPNPVDMGTKGNGYCNYAGGGLFKLNPIEISDHHTYFDFADDPLVKDEAAA